MKADTCLSAVTARKNISKASKRKFLPTFRIKASTKSLWKQYGLTDFIQVDNDKLPVEKDDLNKYQGAFVDAGTTLIYGPPYVIK